MVIKITPQQAKRVNALLRKLCANYDGGNCLLLDDGEPCVCVQSEEAALLSGLRRQAETAEGSRTAAPKAGIGVTLLRCGQP